MAKKGLNIYKRKDGRWEGRVLMNTEEGTRKYRSVYGHSYKEVKERLFCMEKEAFQTNEKCILTVNQVMEQWLHDKQQFWKKSTYACYKQIVRRYFTDSAKKIPASSFTNIQFQGFLNKLRCKNGTEISSMYRRNIGAAVIQAFRYMNREYHYRLPALTNIKVVKINRSLILPSDTEMRCLREYLCLNKQNSTCIGILLAYHTGIRLGELCALKWGDIDFQKGILTVCRNMQRVKDFSSSKTELRIQTPKTMTSVRSIPLPDTLVAVLFQNRRGENDYIIQGRKKDWAEARTVQYRFSVILKKIGIQHFKFHMLRHYFATRCFENGFDVKSLSEILGHATVQTTLNLYVHSSMSQKRKMMNHIYEAAG